MVGPLPLTFYDFADFIGREVVFLESAFASGRVDCGHVKVHSVRRHSRSVLRPHEHLRTQRPPLPLQPLPLQRRFCRQRVLFRRVYLRPFRLQTPISRSLLHV